MIILSLRVATCPQFLNMKTERKTLAFSDDFGLET
jgi:hypothetical protein